ncbi:hypothetical protein KXD40_008748 [Peronospora effusa]|uniref:RxLR effector protein n=1 Tax=Peronospora effusa TaxID=542832 RepID=A0A3M6VN35_9STRA|nr:hypothetical protein DD238_001648 [Peronospora effusa]RQM15300.1 hypothetical protein DD237_003242 [Peronospora effusa]UIZ21781.1 hypothetical protein KXD40_008748 [Peronospora effusa]
MKFQLIGIAAILALTFSKIEAQTLDDPNAADDAARGTVTTLGDTYVTGMELPDTGSLTP